MEVKNIKKLGFVALIAGTMMSCVSDKNSPGLEYMPDMYRSSAVEGYWDYAEVKGKYSEDAYNLVREKFSFVPPVGTIPYAGANADETDMPYKHAAPINADKTHGLYGMAMDSSGILNAKWDVVPSSVKNDPDALKEGEVLYGRFCSHCHGVEGGGDGAVPKTGKFPAPGAYNGPLKDRTAGDIFYVITYGKGAMGSHASQLNKEERWKVTMFVQKLQGNEPGSSPSDSLVVEMPDEPAAPEAPADQEDNGGH